MKTIRRIIAIILILLTIMTSPLSVYFGIENNVYATTTFIQDLESQMFLQTLIPTLIAAGLVFKTNYDWDVNNGSQLHEHIVAESLKEYFNTLGENYKPPNEPDGPNLGEVIKEMLKGITLVSAGYGIGKGIVEIPQMLWELVKSFVDDNYNEGDNIENESTDFKGYSNGYAYNVIVLEPTPAEVYIEISVNDEPSTRLLGQGGGVSFIHDLTHFKILGITKKVGSTNLIISYEYQIKQTYIPTGAITYIPAQINTNTREISFSGQPLNENPYPETYLAYGIENIVDNPNYDWNNNYTDTKVIPIPVEMDLYGNPKKDENGYYLPAIDVDEWLDVQPTEIPNLDPTGIPIPDIPPFPDIENPDDDEQTGIMIYIGNILQIIVGQLSKIVEGVKTIVKNTNRLVFNTPNPIIDPITEEQIDPETGQPVEQSPATESGDGIIGNGIDTNIPTDFEWGDFRHFLDIFFIFIYFIVILILIILKFLQIVFVGLPGIAANTDLFTQYPTILEGVNYVKNLQVGGLTITVHQAFEFVFLIFFYIFIIKQIRKLYNAAVYEESSINHDYKKDMRMDYYERNRHYKPNHFTNISRSEKSQDTFKHAAVYPEDYNNINIIDYTEDN